MKVKIKDEMKVLNKKNKSENMVKRIFKIMVFAAAVFLAIPGQAKLKGLPTIKSYKDYSFSKKNVASVKYTVYAPKVEGEVISKGEVADFITEIFFDENGNRMKEIVYHIETGAVEVNIVWYYDDEKGSVSEVRTDAKGELLARTEYITNYKAGTVLARRYENIIHPVTEEIIPNVLLYEELWAENSKKKTVSFKKTSYSVLDGLAMKQSITEYDLAKPYTLYTILEEETAPIDYSWLPDYSAKLRKTTSGNTKKEAIIYDGSKYEYKAKKKLLSNILYFGSDKTLKSEVTYTYNFDNQKNWTEVVQKEDNKPQFIVIRDIKYRN
jgi:hypothetical protein